MARKRKTITILHALSDDKTLKVFKSIGQNLSIEKRARTNVSSITNLSKIGLIKKTTNGYNLTSLGFVIYQVINLIDEALVNNSKLKAVDEIIYSKDVSREQMLKKVESVLGIKIKGL